MVKLNASRDEQSAATSSENDERVGHPLGQSQVKVVSYVIDKVDATNNVSGWLGR